VRDTARRDGVVAALAAAALFGVATPIAKLLLPGSGALALAALLYSGAGLGLVVIGLARRSLGGEPREAALRRDDLPLLAGVVLSGGVLAPVLLLLGLERLPAGDASLLLNLEAPLTVLLAVALFGEHAGLRVATATALVVLVAMGRIPAWGVWMVVVIVGRELAVTGLRGIASAGGHVMAASWLGKGKTLSQNVAIGALIFHYPTLGLPAHGIGMTLLAASTALTLWSGVLYFLDYSRARAGGGGPGGGSA